MANASSFPLSFFRKILAVAILGGLLVGGLVLAQPQPQPFPAPADLSEIRTNALRLVGEARKDTNLVIGLQLKARKDKDVVRLTCINEKLLQIKALRNVLDDNQRVLEAAETQGAYEQRFGAALSQKAQFRLHHRRF